jgi:hypothetical protein
LQRNEGGSLFGWLVVFGGLLGVRNFLDDARPQAEGRMVIGEYLQRGSLLPFVCAQRPGVHCFDGVPSAIIGRSSYPISAMVPAFQRSYSMSIGAFASWFMWELQSACRCPALKALGVFPPFLWIYVYTFATDSRIKVRKTIGLFGLRG